MPLQGGYGILKFVLLFTQYSYANWVEGGEKENKYRKKLAVEKLRRIKIQTEVLKPKFVVPFASMVRFCHKENSYMNDSMNTPRTTVDFELSFVVVCKTLCNIDMPPIL